MYEPINLYFNQILIEHNFKNYAQNVKLPALLQEVEWKFPFFSAKYVHGPTYGRRGSSPSTAWYFS